MAFRTRVRVVYRGDGTWTWYCPPCYRRGLLPHPDFAIWTTWRQAFTDAFNHATRDGEAQR